MQRIGWYARGDNVSNRRTLKCRHRERKYLLMRASLRGYRNRLERTTTRISQLGYAEQVSLWNLGGFRIQAWHVCKGGFGTGVTKTVAVLVSWLGNMPSQRTPWCLWPRPRKCWLSEASACDISWDGVLFDSWWDEHVRWDKGRKIERRRGSGDATCH